MLRLVYGKLLGIAGNHLLEISLPFFALVFLRVGYETPPCVGGDPSAGSPTDTLLRLNLPC